MLGAHFAAEWFKNQGDRRLAWYNGELVSLAEEVGMRLLPAFDTSTGIPYPRVCMLNNFVPEYLLEILESLSVWLYTCARTHTHTHAHTHTHTHTHTHAHTHTHTLCYYNTMRACFLNSINYCGV